MFLYKKWDVLEWVAMLTYTESQKNSGLFLRESDWKGYDRLQI